MFEREDTMSYSRYFSNDYDGDSKLMQNEEAIFEDKLSEKYDLTPAELKEMIEEHYPERLL